MLPVILSMCRALANLIANFFHPSESCITKICKDNFLLKEHTIHAPFTVITGQQQL